jgi:hypothetical protein
MLVTVQPKGHSNTAMAITMKVALHISILLGLETSDPSIRQSAASMDVQVARVDPIEAEVGHLGPLQ